MIKRFTYLVLCVAVNWNLNAEIYYVQAGATGIGTSWTTATGDLQNVLQIAKNGDEIWVTKGVYFPTKDNNRTISFSIKNGVSLYGGFAGTETSIGERIIKANYSVLSGEIGTKQKTDNTFNVLYIAHAIETTIIDGFIITGGYAAGDDVSGARFASGGGLYNAGVKSGDSSNLTIKNCQFIENTARDGGAIYNNAADGKFCQIALNNCDFLNNKAFLGGGAIFNNGQTNGLCLMSIIASNFTKNNAGYGGAIFNYGSDGECVTTLNNTEFLNNNAMIQGGGIFNLGTDGISKSKLINCNFKDNKAPKGSTVANSQARPKLNKNITKI